MIDKAQARMARVSLVNQLPLNRVAARFLDGPPLETEPAVLTLIRWGLKNGLNPMLALGNPDTDSMMAQVATMATNWKPHQVMRFLVDPESRDDGSVALRVEEMDAASDAESAAALLIESLYYAMVVNTL
jgi:hypothetical protein